MRALALHDALDKGARVMRAESTGSTHNPHIKRDICRWHEMQFLSQPGFLSGEQVLGIATGCGSYHVATRCC